MNNHTYNLIKSLTKKAQALSKYETYLSDAADCDECKNLWQRLTKEDEAQLAEIKKVLENHAKKGLL